MGEEQPLLRLDCIPNRLSKPERRKGSIQWGTVGDSPWTNSAASM